MIIVAPVVVVVVVVVVLTVFSQPSSRKLLATGQLIVKWYYANTMLGKRAHLNTKLCHYVIMLLAAQKKAARAPICTLVHDHESYCHAT